MRRRSAAGVTVDCEVGRRLGCATFCCRLIVRLQAEDAGSPAAPDPRKSCLDKDPEDGLCVHFDRSRGLCRIWRDRPSLCRAYDCNHDPLLQVVLRDGLTSLTDLVRATTPPRESWVQIPYVDGV